MQAPLIDKRSYADLVAQTTQLAGQFSGWRPGPDGQPDPGQALIGIFGRFAALVIERLNRAPDMNYLAFLNLIGASPLPPRPARVPLTFHLATSSPVEAVVPAGTLAAAPAADTDQGEVVFETERPLALTQAQLLAAYVSDTEHDTFSDRFDEATGQTDAPFPVFAADQPQPHQLYLACDQLLTQPGVKDVTLALTSPDSWQWLNWPISWAYWNGTGWQPVTASAAVQGGTWQVTLPALPDLTPSALGPSQAGWLRAQLELPLPPGQSGLIPESIAIGARNPQDPGFPLSPFPADSAVQRFYLSADQAFSAGGAQVRIPVQLSQRGAGPGVQLNWFYQASSQWLPLGQSSASADQTGTSGFDFHDGTRAFTQDGEISFHVPMTWPASVYRTRTGRWLRVDVASGQYTTPPVAAALTVGYNWLLPRLGRVTVAARPSAGAAASPVPPAAAFSNGSAIDLTKDFYPFGQEPRYNDTFYAACPDALASPGAVLAINVTLTNPSGATNSPVPPVPADTNRKVVWEVCDGSQWHPTSATYPFAGNGQLTLTLPSNLSPSEVNGQQGYWLRARLTGGGYGAPASYTQNADHSYTYQPATFAPPVVSGITITATAPPQPPVPVTACLTYNDFDYVDRTTAAAGQGGLFPPFTPTADAQPALYLGFDVPFGQRSVTLFLEPEPPLPEQVGADQLASAEPAGVAQLIWEYYAGQAGWRSLAAVDETSTLTDRGLVTFMGPADLTARSCFGVTLCWLRLRWQTGTFPLPPQLRRVLLNTTWAAQVITVQDEILGSANGDAGQVFTAAQTPVQPGQQLTVREPQPPAPAEEQVLAQEEGAGAVTVILDATGQPDEIWVRWHAVPDFYGSGPRDRHYTIDPLSATIRFGDGTSGLIPPIGQNNVRLTYRSGGGEQGNRAGATIVELKSGVPYVDGVTNNGPSQGGAPVEPIERVQARGPRVLRHRDRAVAAQDLEDLAVAASADVAAAAAVVPIFNPYSLWLDPNAPAPGPDHAQVLAGQVGVIIVPDEPGSPRPAPTVVLLNQVGDYLRERCPATAGLWVAGPEWIAVSVQTTVAVTSVAVADATADQVRAALRGYLHPLTGGPNGQGWPFSQRPHGSELSALLEALDGVDHVHALTVTYQPQTADPQRAAGLQRILAHALTDPPDPPELSSDLYSWLDRALVCSGTHDVAVQLP
ncbi:MAG TPA: putative baseplate assembly protein [Streptosporangiaceae bacterium]|nr:putative baseplate assembly protein [Streptosporangiaceae bacterium]